MSETTIKKHNQDIFLELVKKDDIETLNLIAERLDDFEETVINRVNPDISQHIRSTEMVKFLFENGLKLRVFNTPTTIHPDIKKFLFKVDNIDLVKTAITESPDIRNAVLKSPDEFLRAFLFTNQYSHNDLYNYTSRMYTENKDQTKELILKCLIETYNIPLNKIPILDARTSGLSYQEHIADEAGAKRIIDDVKWYIERGADPRNCGEFIKNMVDSGRNGLTLLKKIQQDGIFNSFAPDPLFHILSSATTKSFMSFVNKAPAEQFSKYTLNGQPAWFGVLAHPHPSRVRDFAYTFMPTLIKDKAIDFNQASMCGNTILSLAIKEHQLAIFNPDKTPSNYLEGILQNYVKSDEFNLLTQGKDGKNFLHRLTFDMNTDNNKFYSTRAVADNLFWLMTDPKHDKTAIISALTQKDNDGATPIGNIIQFLIPHTISPEPKTNPKPQLIDFLAKNLTGYATQKIITSTHHGQPIIDMFEQVFKDYPEQMAVITATRLSDKLNANRADHVKTQPSCDNETTSKKKMKI